MKFFDVLAKFEHCLRGGVISTTSTPILVPGPILTSLSPPHMHTASKSLSTHILIGVSRELVECKKSATLVEPMGEPSSDFTACAS